MLPKLKDNNILSPLLSWLGLFGSFGTLICCAIPSALILMGFGASFASFLNVFPQLIWLSEYKIYIFIFSFSMLFLSYLGQKNANQTSCPIDQLDDCNKTKKWSRYVFILALIINFVGVLYTFVLPALIY